MRLDAFDADAASELLNEMSAEATALVAPGARGMATFERRVGLHALCRPGPRDRGRAAAAAAGRRRMPQALREAYERDYAVLFERHIPNAAIEILSWSVQVSTEAKLPAKQGAAPAVPQPVPVGKRPVFDGRSGRTTECRSIGARPCRPAAPSRARPSSPRTRPRPMSRPVLTRISMPPAVSSWTARTREESMSQSNSVGLIDLQIMWNRLIAVVEEQAQTLMRTAFCPIVRECGDLSAGVFDLEGRMLAQAVTGTPGHVNSMAESVKHFMRHFPVETMKAGDAYITNDPWMGTGHLNDFVITTPCFHNGKLVGAVLLHQPSHGHRRHRLRPGRHRRVHGGALHPVAEAVRPGQGQRDADGDDPRQHAPAGRHRGRRLLAGRLQRRRRPPPGRDDGRVRHRLARRARRPHHRPLARGGAGRDRQAAQGHLAQRHDDRRLRRAARRSRPR